jgi:hypothetical protein
VCLCGRKHFAWVLGKLKGETWAEEGATNSWDVDWGVNMGAERLLLSAQAAKVSAKASNMAPSA